ncbi:hypothetical protein UFOVP262_2 [uncultured Caudovirales phage]|jgi:hypothetical protein|uniref:Uncharacterized protein n=1 Tax=uncultured Caudovirales phage TaxID=2100421 RepID=A0A6J5L0U6_9CAUD|nr:hypothetical protein UFOVP90_38 [uncultured Caudovirales phage]CAB4133742.1 hypothetical protein UFOVP262_2 [uncultured Caudovirales phage]
MNQLANAFGSKFTENKDSLRIKSFELNGHTFRVKVPLTAETDAMFERVKSIDEAKANQFYQEMSKEFIENRVKYENDPDIKYLEDDIEVKETSIKETSRNKVLTQNRITELVRLLVPENKDFDMASITYADIEELFPFSIQMELIDQINNVISPNYSATKGK